MSELGHRHSMEERWHNERVWNEKGAEIDFYAMGALDLADAYAWALLGDVSGKTIVDFGCGGGAQHHAFSRTRRNGLRFRHFLHNDRSCAQACFGKESARSSVR